MKLVEVIKVLTILEGRNLHMSHKFFFGIAKSRTNWKSHLCNLNVMFNSMEHNLLLFVYDVCIGTFLTVRQHNKDEVVTNGNEGNVKTLYFLKEVYHEKNSYWKLLSLYTIVLLHKQGGTEKVENYRPICLLPSIFKAITKVVLKRVERCLEEAEEPTQAGFRPGFSTLPRPRTCN